MSAQIEKINKLYEELGKEIESLKKMGENVCPIMNDFGLSGGNKSCISSLFNLMFQNELNKITQDEFDKLPIIKNMKQCPGYTDYSNIKMFEYCDFGGGCIFKDDSEFNNCNFGIQTSFGDNDKFYNCNINNTSNSGKNCKFEKCRIGNYCEFKEKCKFTKTTIGKRCKFWGYNVFKDVDTGLYCVFLCNPKIEDSIIGSYNSISSGDIIRCSIGEYCDFIDDVKFDTCEFFSPNIQFPIKTTYNGVEFTPTSKVQFISYRHIRVNCNIILVDSMKDLYIHISIPDNDVASLPFTNTNRLFYKLFHMRSHYRSYCWFGTMEEFHKIFDNNFINDEWYKNLVEVLKPYEKMYTHNNKSIKSNVKKPVAKTPVAKTPVVKKPISKKPVNKLVPKKGACKNGKTEK